MRDDTFFLPESFYVAHGLVDLLPAHLRPQAIVLRNGEAIGDLTQMAGGRAARPTKPVVLYGPDNRTPITIVGAGVTEAAELEEIALGAYEKASARAAEGKGVIDFEAFRAKKGLPEKRRFNELLRQAIDDRLAYQRRNWRTEPAPQLSEQPKGNVF